jgi:hypothetical protein
MIDALAYLYVGKIRSLQSITRFSEAGVIYMSLI